MKDWVFLISSLPWSLWGYFRCWFPILIVYVGLKSHMESFSKHISTKLKLSKNTKYVANSNGFKVIKVSKTHVLP